MHLHHVASISFIHNKFVLHMDDLLRFGLWLLTFHYIEDIY
jgi:hypothetical protein